MDSSCALPIPELRRKSSAPAAPAQRPFAQSLVLRKFAAAAAACSALCESWLPASSPAASVHQFRRNCPSRRPALDLEHPARPPLASLPTMYVVQHIQHRCADCHLESEALCGQSCHSVSVASAPAGSNTMAPCSSAVQRLIERAAHLHPPLAQPHNRPPIGSDPDHLLARVQ